MDKMINWIDSKTIKYLFFTWLGSFLLQIVPMLKAHKFDWWDLGAEAIVTLSGILIRLGQNDIVAPKALDVITGGMLNSNVKTREGQLPLDKKPTDN